ncbi:MAG: right-handed parallel beta-helix repeat-containing protein, partial [Saprospiraceae bacterium]
MPILNHNSLFFNSKLRLVLFLGILAIESISNAQSVYFVNAGAAQGGDGLSWSSAINDLQHVMDIACNDTNAEIWVARGTYYPNKNIGDSSTGSKDRSNTFLLCNHVALYGGFIGDEVIRDERNWDLNITVLSGDIDSLPAVDSTNAYQVVSVFFADSTVVLDGFTISDGYANNEDNEKFDFSIGGGINLKGSTCTVQNCTITENHAQTGAGIEADSCALMVNNCTFRHNETILNFGSGGGASMESDASTFIDCLFDLNHSLSSGGGLTTRSNSSTNLIRCTFQNNSSPRGGGLSTSFTNALEMVDCIFTGNLGTADGGAIYNNVNKLTTFHNCVFNGNETNGSGGAIYCNGSDRIELFDCDISNNKAYNGGGVYLSFSLGVIQNTTIRGNEANSGGGISSLRALMDLNNSVISGNLAEETGGAIEIQSSVTKLTNTTLSGNEAGTDGGALYLDGSAGNTYTVINNSILWNNEASFDTASSSASIFISNNVFTKIASSLIANSGGSENWNSGLGLDSGNNIDVNPLFVENILIDTIPVTSGDFHLTINSPAINAGSIDTTGLYIKMTDADGYERIVDGRIDMGAYEFQEVSTVPICIISGPDIITAFTMAEYIGPVGMASYSWTAAGNGNIIGSPQNQTLTIVAGAVSSFLVTLSVVDIVGIETTCALKVNIQPDCALYDHAQVIYVNANATGANNGINWTDAFAELKDALQIDCPAIKEIWVAAGTYYPEYFSPDRLVTFQLKNGIGLYGGFAGDETLLKERNWIMNPAILSGDRDRDGDNTANSYNVVVGSGTDSTAVLDGFTITAGKADSYVRNQRESAGAGIYLSNASPVIRNCTISDNTSADGSAGLYNSNSAPSISNCIFIHNSATDGISGGMKNSNKSSPAITDCFFIENMARRSGGGMGNYDSSPTLVNCHFDKNTVLSGQGGGMNNSSSIPVLINCTFTENSARNGAGIYNSTSSPKLDDCTFNNNKGRDGCGMFNTGGAPQLTNCHFTGNKTSSGGRGGGMLNQFSSAPVLTGCV